MLRQTVSSDSAIPAYRHTLIICSLAYAEMRLLLAKMLWHFDFELEDPDTDWTKGLRAFTTWERTPMRVRLTPLSR